MDNLLAPTPIAMAYLHLSHATHQSTTKFQL